MSEVRRFEGPDDLAAGAASALLDALIALQADGRTATLCTTTGRMASRVMGELGRRVEGSALDPGRLELWWADERFVPTDDPRRNAGQTLALLAGQFVLDPARTHPMPASDGVPDNASAAATYAKELGSTTFDIALLGVGMDGHVASIFPDHPSSEPTSHRVIAVNDAPSGAPERVSLTVEAISESTEVWFLVSGAEKAAILPRALAGEEDLPAGRARGMARTVWLVDAAASHRILPYDCRF